MKTTLIFLRHGQSEANERGIVQGQGLNIPLTKEGKKQARAAAKKLKDFTFDKIFTSTAVRAIETAEIVKSLHPDTPLIKIPELNERSKGLAEGMPKEEFNKRYPEIVKQWAKEIDARPEGGENLEDLHRRVVPVIEKQVREDSTGSTFLYVIHGNVIKALLGYMLKIPFSLRGRIKLDYCALSCASYDHQRKRWEIEYINQQGVR